MPNFTAIAGRFGAPAPAPDTDTQEMARRMGMNPVDRADGSFLIEHKDLFASIFGAGINSYYTRFDEALKSSYEDAIAMRNDASVWELCRHRQYPVLNVPHYLRPDDPKNKSQVSFCTELMRILDATVDMEDLRLANLEAIFWGKAGAQLAFGRRWINGAQRVCVVGHEPIHGDKIVHQFNGTPGVMIHTGAVAGIEAKGGETFRSDRAICLKLANPFWRSRFTLHQHEPSDAEFLWESDKAAAKFGLGLRDRIYWVWWLRQEVLAWTMNAMKRIGANGNFIGMYEEGNDASKRAVLEALKAFSDHGATAFPKRPGMDGNLFEHIPPTAIAYEVMMGLIEYLDGIIRRAIVGQELTGVASNTGMGSNQSDVQADVLTGINAYDAKKLGGCLTRDLIPTLIRENFGPIQFGVKLIFEPEADERQKRLALARQFVDLGQTLDLSDEIAEAGFKQVQPGTPGATANPPAATGGGKPPAGPGDEAKPDSVERMSRTSDDDVIERYAKAEPVHAPSGGVTIDGKEFAPGEFIPARIVSNAEFTTIHKDHADLYREVEPDSIGRAARGEAPSMDEYELARARLGWDKLMASRIAKAKLSKHPIDHPDHPDPEAAVTAHHVEKFRATGGTAAVGMRVAKPGKGDMLEIKEILKKRKDNIPLDAQEHETLANFDAYKANFVDSTQESGSRTGHNNLYFLPHEGRHFSLSDGEIGSSKAKRSWFASGLSVPVRRFDPGGVEVPLDPERMKEVLASEYEKGWKPGDQSSMHILSHQQVSDYYRAAKRVPRARFGTAEPLKPRRAEPV